MQPPPSSPAPAPPADRRRVGTALALTAAIVLSACTPSPPAGPDFFELANIDPENIVPKSSPAVLVRAFSDFCVDRIDDPASIPALLKANDYVAVPEFRPNSARLYVVDDRRPMVMLSDGPESSTCAVAAESRTGQTNRVLSFVATEFPAARAIDPSGIGPTAEAAWYLPGTSTIVFILREGTASSPAQIVVGMTRTRENGGRS
jgi:hypothetical protein